MLNAFRDSGRFSVTTATPFSFKSTSINVVDADDENGARTLRDKDARSTVFLTVAVTLAASMTNRWIDGGTEQTGVLPRHHESDSVGFTCLPCVVTTKATRPTQKRVYAFRSGLACGYMR